MTMPPSPRPAPNGRPVSSRSEHAASSGAVALACLLFVVGCGNVRVQPPPGGYIFPDAGLDSQGGEVDGHTLDVEPADAATATDAAEPDDVVDVVDAAGDATATDVATADIVADGGGDDLSSGDDVDSTDAEPADGGDDGGDDADTAESDLFVAQCVEDDDCIAVLADLGDCDLPICLSGVCAKQPLAAGTPCGEGSCTSAGDAMLFLPRFCTDGACELSGQATACDDGIGCTADDCTPADGCTAAPDSTACDDNNDCTVDSCAVGKGCSYADAFGPCDDSDPCTQGDICTQAQCLGGANNCACTGDLDCDTVHPCRPASCGGNGLCVNGAAPGAACEDGDACTSKDICNGAGLCFGQAKSCDDGLLCTIDACSKNSGCSHVTDPTACDDGNPCTAELCAEGVGCLNPAKADGPCEEGNACTINDLCLAGVCIPGPAKLCDDGNSCTIDGCAPESGECGATPLADGTVCDDDDACTEEDACAAGACAGGVSPCDDGNQCSEDGCDKTGGCTHTPAGGLLCNADENLCTESDICIQDICIAGTPLICDDGTNCTVDACVPSQGCVFIPVANGKPCGDAGAETMCQAGQCKPVVPPDGMSWVPEGIFQMGCNAATDNQCKIHEKPYHGVQVSTFFIDTTEVTAGAWLECVTKAICSAPTLTGSGDATYGVPSKTEFPVNYVTWDQAKLYCSWRSARLCTEAEWELAARGTDGRRYPWGDKAPTCSLANFNGCPEKSAKAAGATPAGVSPYGAHDMAGNLREWVADWYQSDWYTVDGGVKAVLDPTGPKAGTAKVVRGGYYKSDAPELRVSSRGFVSPQLSAETLGFRCCQSL